MRWDRRKIRQVTRGTRNQAHRQHLAAGFSIQTPLARPVAQRSAQPRRRTGLQFRRRVGSRFPGRQIDGDPRPRGLSEVVGAPNGHGNRFVAAVEQPQQADLVDVGTRVKGGNAEPLAVARGDFVHLGKDIVPGAHIGLHLDVEVAGQFQVPVAPTAAGGAGEAGIGVAGLQIVGVEVRRPAGVKRQTQPLVPCTGGVDGHDIQRAGFVGEVDDPHQALGTGVGGGREEGHDVRRRPLLGNGQRRKDTHGGHDRRTARQSGENHVFLS